MTLELRVGTDRTEKRTMFLFVFHFLPLQPFYFVVVYFYATIIRGVEFNCGGQAVPV